MASLCAEAVDDEKFTPHKWVPVNPKYEHLTQNEERIAYLLLMSDREIAMFLGLAKSTVKVYAYRIRHKLSGRLGLMRRFELANYSRDGALGEEFTLP